MPLSLDLAHKLLMVLAEIRREGKVMTYLRPDSKSQVTIEYDDDRRPVRIDTIVVSTQHDEFIQPADDSKEAQLKADEEMLAKIRQDVIEILMPRVISSNSSSVPHPPGSAITPSDISAMICLRSCMVSVSISCVSPL
jgi:S-adenosylmethionine synthetase